MRQVFPHLLILPPAAANIAKLAELLLGDSNTTFEAMRIFRRLARFQNEFYSIWRVLLVSRINFFQLAKPSRTSLNKDEARRIAANVLSTHMANIDIALLRRCRC
jgi:hypothetical protein